MSNDISTNLVVHGEPRIETFLPKTGRNANTEQSVVVFKAYHPNFTRDDEGKWQRLESNWYTVRFYGDGAKKINDTIKDGMQLEVRGQVAEKEWKGKDGQKRYDYEITARAVAISIVQPGLESVKFQKPERKTDKQAEAKAPEATPER